MRSKLTTIILIGMVLGILVGYACHTLWPDPKTAKTTLDRSPEPVPDDPLCDVPVVLPRRSWQIVGTSRIRSRR